MAGCASTIREVLSPGDHILFYHSEKLKYLVQLPKQGKFSTHRGQIDFEQVLGLDFGDEVRTHLGFGFHVLRPTLADLELRVHRTTTVVYPKDVGRMLLETAVFPGARVIEVGSGSGALTTVLASFVRPDGRVYSYERRPEFSENARRNVERYGLADWCEFFVADPEQSGFKQQAVDAVLLDVPEPWSLLQMAHAALRGGNSLVAIVPTTEQLRKTFSAMEIGGFTRIRVSEVLERGIYVRPSGIRPADRMVAHTVYLVFGHKIWRQPDCEAAG